MPCPESHGILQTFDSHIQGMIVRKRYHIEAKVIDHIIAPCLYAIETWIAMDPKLISTKNGFLVVITQIIGRSDLSNPIQKCKMKCSITLSDGIFNRIMQQCISHHEQCCFRYNRLLFFHCRLINDRSLFLRVRRYCHRISTSTA